MKGDLRCIEGRLFRHDPQWDDPPLKLTLVSVRTALVTVATTSQCQSPGVANIG